MVALPIRKPELHNCKSLTSFFFSCVCDVYRLGVGKKGGGGGGRGEAKQLTLSDWSSKCIPLPHLHCFNTRPSNSESFSKSSPWHWNKNESISATMHSAIANYNFFLQLTKFFPIFVTRNL